MIPEEMLVSTSEAPPGESLKNLCLAFQSFLPHGLNVV